MQSKSSDMKYFLVVFLFVATIAASAQKAATVEKDYLPELKTMNISLVGGLNMSKRAEELIKYGYKEYPELQQYFLEDQKNVRYFRISQGSGDFIYEYKFLDDGSVYQLNLYMAHNGTEATGTGMLALKIIFNNSSKKIVDELGMPTQYDLFLLSPYLDSHFDDNDQAMAALRSLKLVNSAKWFSKKYKGTDWEKTPVIELSMHFANRVRYSVTDIELLKRAKKP